MIAAVDSTLSAAARAEVRRRCDGVPLYIEEVVAKLAAEQANTLRDVATQWERVPDALYEPLFAQLRSSDNAVPVVVAAATIGRDVDRTMLQSVLTLEPDELNVVIAELERTRVFESIGEDAWRFRHELLREVAAELPPPSQRKALHGRIADVIAGLPGAQPDSRELALHYGYAERFDEAAEACLRASDDARRRGALGEARTYLSRCLEHIARTEPGRSRNRREIAARLRRGFLISAAEGTTSPDAAADFEQCLELAGTSPSREMIATLTALYSYYLTRCDLRRADQLLKSVRSLAGEARGWLRPVNDSGVGQLDWFRGEFDAARVRLEECAAADSLVSALELERTWFMPHEPIAGIHTNLALARFVHGDVSGTADAMLAAERRCEQLTFPHGPFTLSYARTLEAWIAMEAGDFPRANGILDDLMASSERHGFDGWMLIAMAQRASAAALAAVSAETIDASSMKAHLASVGVSLDTLRAVHLVTFLTVFEAVLARLWLRAGEPERARERIEAALAQSDETGLDFYRVELLRHRASTWPDTERRDADLATAAELATRQNATIFALRVAVDRYVIDPSGGRDSLATAAGAFPSDSTWPELARALALLG